MNTTRTQRIADIIEKRRPLAEKIAVVEVGLKSLAVALGELKERRDRLMTQVDDPSVGVLQEIDLSGLSEKIHEESRLLAILRERFGRHTLNIGVVGLMGQGKSTLLKSLSGLTDNEIPALEGGACTAVRSTIENIVGDTTAEVTFHSEDSFLQEVILPYYAELGLKDRPSTLDAFANQQFSLSSASGATDEKMFMHLRDDYHANLKQYRYLLKPGIPQQQPIKKEEIPEYVIQKRDAQDRLTTFKHLAVRSVKIFCAFKNADAGKIALVDVPGMGDSRLGDEKLLLKTLGEEVDVVLFIRRPDPLRYQWQPVDTQLYDTAAKALNDLPSRSFMILNHSLRTNNLQACETLKTSIDTIKVVRSEIADCSNTEDANRVFDLVLDHLAIHINDLDKRYAKACQNRLIALHHEINTWLVKARPALAQYSGESRQFRSLFNKLLQDVINGMVDLKDQLFFQREEIDPYFQAAVNTALQNCENHKGIPTEKEIKNRSRDLEFKGSYQAIYRVYVAELRTHLSQQFLSLNQGLAESIDQMKSSVTDVLVTKGRLEELTQVRGTEFLQFMADLLAERQNKLELGFRTLSDFEFSYGGSLLPLIRRHLEGLLQSDLNNPILEAKTQPESNPLIEPANATEVRSNLEALHKKAVENCQQTLDNWLKAPSRVRYYMVAEFIDRILYAKDMKAEWEILLSEEDIRMKVWPEFKDLARRKQVQQDWLNAVEKVAELNQLSGIMFIN